MSTTAQAQAGRDRARERRLKVARERRRQLDPQQQAREQRISGATVDVELAWEARDEAERAMAAEIAAGTAIERLLGERLSVTNVVELTGCISRPPGDSARPFLSERSSAVGNHALMNARRTANTLPPTPNTSSSATSPVAMHRPSGVVDVDRPQLVRVSGCGSWAVSARRGGHG